MTHVTCRLTTKNRAQLRNPTLGNRVWATILMSYQARPLDHGPLCLAGNNTIHHSHSLHAQTHTFTEYSINKLWTNNRSVITVRQTFRLVGTIIFYSICSRLPIVLTVFCDGYSNVSWIGPDLHTLPIGQHALAHYPYDPLKMTRSTQWPTTHSPIAFSASHTYGRFPAPISLPRN